MGHNPIWGRETNWLGKTDLIMFLILQEN